MIKKKELYPTGINDNKKRRRVMKSYTAIYKNGKSEFKGYAAHGLKEVDIRLLQPEAITYVVTVDGVSLFITKDQLKFLIDALNLGLKELE